MRVAVKHTDPEHPNAGVAAYRFGRVQDMNHPLTGELISKDTIMVHLLDAARKEFSTEDGYVVRAERLSDADEDGEGHWQAIDEDALRARADGESVDVPLVMPAEVNHEVSALQDTETSSGLEG
jgi:hypothetical protein